MAARWIGRIGLNNESFHIVDRSVPPAHGQERGALKPRARHNVSAREPPDPQTRAIAEPNAPFQEEKIACRQERRVSGVKPIVTSDVKRARSGPPDDPA